MRYVKGLIFLLFLCLVGCGEQEPELVQYDKITVLDNVAFSVPSDFRKNKESYTSYYKNQSSIENHFATGVIEESSPDKYILTDRDSFYIAVCHGTGGDTSCYYMESPQELQGSLKSLAITKEMNVDGKLLRSEGEDFVRLSSYTEFTIPFGEDTVTKKLCGYLSLLECHGEQYYFLCGMSEESYDEKRIVDTVSTFVYSGEKSSLYASEDIEYLGTLENQVAIPFSRDLFIETNEGWELPSYNALLFYQTANTQSDRELTFAEQCAQINRDTEIGDGYQYTPIYNGKCAGTDGTIWNIITYEVSQKGDITYETDCFGLKERSSVIMQFSYMENPAKINHLALNLLKKSAFSGYTKLDGSVITGKMEQSEEPSTKVTTERVTEVITELSTEAVTTEGAATESATTAASTTEVVTTETITEMTTEAAASTQAPERKKTEKNTRKKANSSSQKADGDLDVEW